jgi:hypothetical protein
MFGSYFSWSDKSTARIALDIAFKASVAFFILFLILVFIHFTVYPVFSFSPNEDGIISIPTVSDRQITYTKMPAASDTPTEFLDVPSCTYTVGLDIFLSGNFQASNLPRVLLYRAVNNSVSPPQTDTVTNLISRFPDSNILVWLDPMKNDLFVSIVSSGDGGKTKRLETTEAIDNVPVKDVFRATIVFSQQFLEVYINGYLRKSMAIQKNLLTAADNSVFYPVISSIGPNVLVANVAFWPRILSAREVRANGSPISNNSFFSKSAF